MRQERNALALRLGNGQYGEEHRATDRPRNQRDFDHSLLIERGIGKAEAHEILRASGIKRPAMYELGYHNNNCVGCVKGGMGYWNKIRVDFPDVFEARAKLEREVGASCINGVYLDELDPERGRHDGPIVDDCGIMCELQSLSGVNKIKRPEVRERGYKMSNATPRKPPTERATIN